MNTAVTSVPCCLDYIVVVSHVFGIFTAIVLTGVGTETVVDGYSLGVYVLICAAAVYILETAFVLRLLVRAWTSSDNCVFRFLENIGSFDGWPKSAVYALLGVVCFSEPKIARLPVFGGLALELLAVLYLLNEVRNRMLERQEARQSSLNYHSYERFRQEPVPVLVNQDDYFLAGPSAASSSSSRQLGLQRTNPG